MNYINGAKKAISDGDIYLFERLVPKIKSTKDLGYLIMYVITDGADDEYFLKILLDSKADVNVQDASGNTALMLSENESTINLLLEYKADPNIQNNKGNVPLMINYNMVCCQLLLEAKTDLTIKNKMGFSSLLYAKFMRDVQKFELIKNETEKQISELADTIDESAWEEVD